MTYASCSPMNDRIAVRTKAVFVSSNLFRTSQRLMLCSRLKRDAATDSSILSPAENVPSSRIVLKKISSRSRFTCCQTRESWANADVRIMSAARQSDARLSVFICSSLFMRRLSGSSSVSQQASSSTLHVQVLGQLSRRCGIKRLRGWANIFCLGKADLISPLDSYLLAGHSSLAVGDSAETLSDGM